MRIVGRQRVAERGGKQPSGHERRRDQTAKGLAHPTRTRVVEEAEAAEWRRAAARGVQQACIAVASSTPRAQAVEVKILQHELALCEQSSLTRRDKPRRVHFQTAAGAGTSSGDARLAAMAEAQAEQLRTLGARVEAAQEEALAARAEAKRLHEWIVELERSSAGATGSALGVAAADRQVCREAMAVAAQATAAKEAAQQEALKAQEEAKKALTMAKTLSGELTAVQALDAQRSRRGDQAARAAASRGQQVAIAEAVAITEAVRSARADERRIAAAHTARQLEVVREAIREEIRAEMLTEMRAELEAELRRARPDVGAAQEQEEEQQEEQPAEEQEQAEEKEQETPSRIHEAEELGSLTPATQRKAAVRHCSRVGALGKVSLRLEGAADTTDGKPKQMDLRTARRQLWHAEEEAARSRSKLLEARKRGS